jgi:mannose-6-phosphate isomerase class I
MLGLGGGYQERDWGFDLAYQFVARSGSINEPASGENWALNTSHQRLSATYRVRF